MDLSIVVTSFNYEKYIRNCIDSCIHQQNHDLKYEIIVVNDGSTDGTAAILDSYSMIQNIFIYNITNSGIEKASNYGFSKSKGNYIVRVDADDALLPNYIKSIQEEIKNKKDFIYSNYSVVDEQGNIFIRESKLPKFDVKEIMARGDFLATGTAYRKDLIKFLDGYNESVTNSGLENYEFIIKLIEEGYQGYLVKDISFLYRRHALNISKLKKDVIINNGKILFKNLNLGDFKTNKYHPYGLKVN